MLTDKEIADGLRAADAAGFKRTRGIYKDGDCYCAVGVLAKTLGREYLHIIEGSAEVGFADFQRAKIGFARAHQLIFLNDTMPIGKTFSEVAAEFEKK